jgi:hypothetical protein
MQTITFNDSSISAYTFDDAHDLVATAENITCPHFVIGDMNTSNATIHTGVTPPADWQGGMYLFDGATWTLNPNWTDPKLAEIERLTAELDALQSV